MSNAITNGFTISNGTITKHSLTDYGLAVANTNYIGNPEMETFTVNVPGRNGLLDLSTFLTGYPIFKSREISIEVGAVKVAANWDAFISEFRNNFEGRECKITFDNDTDWYWKGRVSVTDFDRHRNLGTFTIVMIADAFKYKVTPTIDSYTTSGGNPVAVTWRSTYTHPIIPTFKAITASAVGNYVIVHPTGGSGQTLYELPTGIETTIPGFNSKTTGYDIAVAGNSVIKVTWREMSL